MNIAGCAGRVDLHIVSNHIEPCCLIPTRLSNVRMIISVFGASPEA